MGLKITLLGIGMMVAPWPPVPALHIAGAVIFIIGIVMMFLNQ